MSKYRALFVEESREHLGELSRLAVMLEASPEPSPLIDEIFRHAHSLKGMAASMGYDPISSLAHRLEDLVDLTRRAAKGVSKELIDCLLRAVDALSNQVDCIAEEKPLEAYIDLVHELSRMAQAGATPAASERAAQRPDGGEHAGQRGAAAAGVASPGASPVAAAPAPASTPTPTLTTSTKTPTAAPGASDAAAAAPATVTGSAALPAAGKSRLVRVRINDMTSSPAVRAFLVHRRLGELTPIIESRPSIDQLRLGQLPDMEISFVVSTTVEEAAVRRVLASVPDVESVTLDLVDAAEPAVKPTPKAAPAPEAAEGAKSVSTVRVRTEVLDGLINSVGELFIARERLHSLLSDIARPDVRAALDGLSARIREIHDQVMAVRMMPMRTLTDRYPRLVRDLARSLKKDVELEVAGGDIELDRAILDNLDTLFIHTLRNAVDHGIEDPLERARRGKPHGGKITISAARDRDMVLVAVEDDGRGLDAEVLRRAAVQRGLVSPQEAESLTARECYFLICLPGFSTKAEVSAVSGRGVGMDAVRSKVESLGGTLDIESELGRGTRFVWRLPLSLAIVPVLLVEGGTTLFAIPVAKIVSIRERGVDYIPQPGGRYYLSFRHALVPVVTLAELLKLNGKRQGAGGGGEQVVVLEDGRDLAGLGVSRIVGYHEVVAKPLGDPLDRLEWFSGAAILGDGQPILILDVPRALRRTLAA